VGVGVGIVFVPPKRKKVSPYTWPWIMATGYGREAAVRVQAEGASKGARK